MPPGAEELGREWVGRWAALGPHTTETRVGYTGLAGKVLAHCHIPELKPFLFSNLHITWNSTEI
jgi:hypothetical protein